MPAHIYVHTHVEYIIIQIIPPIIQVLTHLRTHMCAELLVDAHGSIKFIQTLKQPVRM